MAPAQAQLEAQHLPGSATWAELCHQQGAAALGRPRRRALEGGHCVPLVPQCHAAVVSLLPSGCHHRSQRRSRRCLGAAGWAQQGKAGLWLVWHLPCTLASSVPLVGYLFGLIIG